MRVYASKLQRQSLLFVSLVEIDPIPYLKRLNNTNACFLARFAHIQYHDIQTRREKRLSPPSKNVTVTIKRIPQLCYNVRQQMLKNSCLDMTVFCVFLFHFILPD